MQPKLPTFNSQVTSWMLTAYLCPLLIVSVVFASAVALVRASPLAAQVGKVVQNEQNASSLPKKGCRMWKNMQVRSCGQADALQESSIRLGCINYLITPLLNHLLLLSLSLLLGLSFIISSPSFCTPTYSYPLAVPYASPSHFHCR